MSTFIKTAVCVALATCAAPASAASIYNLTFFTSGSGLSSVYGQSDRTFTLATLRMGIVVGDDMQGGTAATASGIVYAASAATQGINFFATTTVGVAPGVSSRGLACFGNPSAMLPLGMVAVDPSCSSITYTDSDGRSSRTFTGTITGLEISRGASTTGISFVEGVPEPATWALMLTGFGMIGYAMRRRRLAYA